VTGAPAVEVAFPLLGRPFRASGLPAPLAAWLREHWYFPEHTPPPHPYDISLTRSAAYPRPASGAPHRVRLHGGRELEWRVEGAEGAERWWTGTGAAGVRLELGAEGSRIEVWGAEGGGADLHAALYLALCEALRASGLLPLHAAVVVRDGGATALCGRSGVGKSTALLTALRAGWAPLAEDLSWLDPASLTLHGWDRGVRLWPEGRDRLPDYAALQWDTDADGKLFLPYGRLPTPPRRSAPLVRVLALHRDPARPSGIEPLPAREAVRVLWESTGVPLSPASRDAASLHVRDLIERIEISRLRLGPG
jgi:hypothetical protein